MVGRYDKALKLFQSDAELLIEHRIEAPLNWSDNFYEQDYVNHKIRYLEKAEQLINQSIEYAKYSFQNMCKAFERANDNIAIQEIEWMEKN